MCVLRSMKAIHPPYHRLDLVRDLEPELPLLILAGILFAVTVIAVYVYAGSL